MSRPSWFRAVLVTAVVCSGASASWAQVALPQNAPAPTGAAKTTERELFPKLRFDRLTGMAKGAITAIVQDSTGYIWFGTEEGLSRYDGYEFVHYVHAEGKPDVLSSYNITSLAAAKGVLWIGTEKGLNRLELATGKVTKLVHDDKDPASIGSDVISSLHVAKSGALWIGTDSGVDVLDAATGKVQHHVAIEGRPDTLADNATTSLAEDKDGNVWIGTLESGLDKLDPKTGKVTHFRNNPDQGTSLSNDAVTALHHDREGVLWVATMNGLNRFDATGGTFKRFLATKGDQDPTWVTLIVESLEGGLWLGIKDVGVYHLEPKSGAVERHLPSSDPTSITHPWPRAGLADQTGVIWFGFNAGGASKLYPLRRQFAYYDTKPGLAFLEDGDRVWLGTRGRGLRALNLKTGQVTTYLDDELNATLTTTIVAADDNAQALWIGTTDRGLLRFNPTSGVLDTYDNESGLLKSNSVFSVLRDGDTLWIGTGDEGVARFDTSTKSVTNFSYQESDPGTLSANYAATLHQDQTAPDTLWVGTNGGLNKLDKRSGRVVRFLNDPAKPTSLTHNFVTDIYEDAKGRMWVSTWGGGLNLLDRKAGTFVAFRASDGLASDVIYGIMEDKAGALWLTTNDGLTRFDPETKTATKFGAGDGLQDDVFGQGGFHQGASGRLYAGGPRGFNVFRPEAIKPDLTPPVVAITQYELLGKSQPIPTSLSLGFRDRWFSFSFAALSYSAPTRNRYRYRLVGQDTQWTETDRRFVPYQNLNPGDYTFELLAANPMGVWSTQPIRIPIHVEPPPWRTWWAYVGYCSIIAIVGGLFLQRQRRQLKALHQQHRLSELEREIELTSAVQEGFLPPQPSVEDGLLRLEGFYRPATRCSGDWWWYEARGDIYFIMVGDVTGHGAGSAMVTAAAASCFRSLGMRFDDDDRLTEMNDEVLRVGRGQYHMTLTTLTLNIRTGHYVMRSGGGVPMFLLPNQRKTKVVMCPGMPLGSEDFQVGRLEGQLAPGDRIMILTDGIPEVAMANSQLLGPRGVSNFYMQTREQDIPSALQALVKKVEAVQFGPQDDDWTVVMLQWGAPDPNAIAPERDTTVTTTRVMP